MSPDGSVAAPGSLFAGITFAASEVWVLLLVPIVAVTAFMVWQFDPAWEFFGSIAGLAVVPVIVGTRPVPCALDGCDGSPQLIWPFIAAAGVMVAAGLLLGTRSSSVAGREPAPDPNTTPTT